MRTGYTKTMTPKQIKANRHNALKSTGPRTPAGKARVSLNASKHGLLSGEVVVRGLHYKESHYEFREFRERYRQHLAPVGPLEETLVEHLVANRWRARRILIAESGEIAHNVDNGCRWREEHPLGLSPDIGDIVTKFKRSEAGCECLIGFLEALRQDVMTEGGLTDWTLKRFGDQFGGKPNVMTEKLAAFRAMRNRNPEGLKPEALQAKHAQSVLEYIGNEMMGLSLSLGPLREQEEKKEAALQAAAVVPQADTLEKLLEYETALDRQFFRLLDRLERLQRMRRGEIVPPPLTMEVSHPC